MDNMDGIECSTPPIWLSQASHIGARPRASVDRGRCCAIKANTLLAYLARKHAAQEYARTGDVSVEDEGMVFAASCFGSECIYSVLRAGRAVSASVGQSGWQVCCGHAGRQSNSCSAQLVQRATPAAVAHL